MCNLHLRSSLTFWNCMEYATAVWRCIDRKPMRKLNDSRYYGCQSSVAHACLFCPEPFVNTAASQLDISTAVPSVTSGGRCGQTCELAATKVDDTHDRGFRAAPSRIVAGDSGFVCQVRTYKLASIYSKLFQVTAVRGNSVVLENGQRWNLRRCSRHQSSLRPSLAQGTENQSVVQPEQSACQHPPPQRDTEPEEAYTAYFMFETSAAAQPQTCPSGPRCSNRVRCHKDFGSFTRY
jgi:hypothetical protein